MHWSNIIKSKVHTKYKGIFSTQRIKRCYQKDFASKLIKIYSVQTGRQAGKGPQLTTGNQVYWIVVVTVTTK